MSKLVEKYIDARYGSDCKSTAINNKDIIMILWHRDFKVYDSDVIIFDQSAIEDTPAFFVVKFSILKTCMKFDFQVYLLFRNLRCQFIFWVLGDCVNDYIIFLHLSLNLRKLYKFLHLRLT